jgi:hypothetical protein
LKRVLLIADWPVVYVVKMNNVRAAEMKAARIKNGANHITAVKQRKSKAAGSVRIFPARMKC